MTLSIEQQTQTQLHKGGVTMQGLVSGSLILEGPYNGRATAWTLHGTPRQIQKLFGLTVRHIDVTAGMTADGRLPSVVRTL